MKTMNKNNKLGKGIASLLTDLPSFEIPEGKKPEQNGLLLIDINEITVNSNQPRKVFNDDTLNELAVSIKENGIIQPLVVEKLNDTFHLISGERRLRASKIAGITKVPVIFKRVTAREKAVMALVENIQREDLNCVDEAMSYFSLLDDYKLTQEELAKKIGKSRSSITNLLRLLKLPKIVLDALKVNKLSLGHGKVLLSIVDQRERCIKLANISIEDSLSVRDLEQLLLNKSPKKEVSSQKVKNDDYQHIINEIEQKTGYHCDFKMNKKGKGKIVIKFSSKDEFDSIFNDLIK